MNVCSEWRDDYDEERRIHKQQNFTCITMYVCISQRVGSLSFRKKKIPRMAIVNLEQMGPVEN